MKLITDRVKHLLIKYPVLRDSDNRLVANVWAEDLDRLGIPQGEALQALADGVLTKPESIRRSRQKVQEENPRLRGAKYRERQAEQPQVIKQLFQTGG